MSGEFKSNDDEYDTLGSNPRLKFKRFLQKFDEIKSRMAASVSILMEAQKFEATFRAFERDAHDSLNIEKVWLSSILVSHSPCRANF